MERAVRHARPIRHVERHLDELLAEQGRATESVRRTVMTGLVFGRTSHEITDRATRLYDGAPAELRERGIVGGGGSEIKEQLAGLEHAGVQRVMLQWLDLDDIDSLKALARVIL